MTTPSLPYLATWICAGNFAGASSRGSCKGQGWGLGLGLHCCSRPPLLSPIYLCSALLCPIMPPLHLCSALPASSPTACADLPQPEQTYPVQAAEQWNPALAGTDLQASRLPSQRKHALGHICDTQGACAGDQGLGPSKIVHESTAGLFPADRRRGLSPP